MCDHDSPLFLPWPPERLELDAWFGVMCQYCRLVFEVAPCAEGQRDGLTSGICDDCLPTAAAEFVADDFELDPLVDNDAVREVAGRKLAEIREVAGREANRGE